jgi:serine/threonine protein kinase
VSKDVALHPRAVPFGSYYLLERLAVGGMAEVYLAKSFVVTGVERLVALKRILPSIAEDDEFIAMFIDEAKIAGQLNHANVAQIFDLGKINSSYFIAMEYVSGHDLRALWERTRDSSEGLPIGLACYVTQKICDGLDYAHRRRDNRGRPLNIIHRDVSPQNILMSYDGDVKVIDFGIAKAANRMVRTQTGILKGKFAYMAPEQARGEPTDHRADIFAIGVILYELLTGERAFKAESDFALLEKVRKVDLVPPRKLKPHIPKDLERIVYKAMEREAGDRYAHASVMAGELDRFMQNHGITYNREETSAYIRRTFREEFDEEKRRLEVYRGFKIDPTPPKENKAKPVPEVRPTTVEVGPEQATRVKADPSLEGRRVDEEIHFLGTEMGDAMGDDDDEAVAAPTETTRLLSDDDDSARAAKPPAGQSAAPRAPRVGSRARALQADDGGPSSRLDKGATHIVTSASEPSRPDADKTRVFSSAEESEGGATMLDDLAVENPHKDDESDMRYVASPDGTRPDVRASALGHVLSEAKSDADGARVDDARRALDDGAPNGRRRARSEWSDDPIVGPHGAGDASGRVPTARIAASGAQVPMAGMVVAATPVHNPMADRGMGLAVGLAIGVLFSIVTALVVGDDHDTIILAVPRESRVKELEETICTKTPCAVHLGSGKHELVFLADGYDPLSRTVDVTGEKPVVVDVQLPRRTSGLVLETAPGGAKVSLNGKVLSGETPLPLPELVVGDKIEIQISLKGFETLQEIVEVPDASTGPWRFQLLAATSVWTIVTEPADAVVIGDDGKPQEGKALLRVERNKGLAYRVARPGCEPFAGAVQGTGRAEEKHEVKLSCRPFDSRLTVQTRPRTEIVVDGVELPMRRTLNGYELPAGPHEVIVRGRRGKEEKLVIELRRGEALEVVSKVR